MSPDQDLWPADFGQSQVETPVAILRTQGQQLGKRTKNVVYGRVKTFTIPQNAPGIPPGFRHVFYLFCAPLAYETELFFVDHGVDFYPAKIHGPGLTGEYEANSPNEFAEKLKLAFAAESTKKIISSLLAQSTQ